MSTDSIADATQRARDAGLPVVHLDIELDEALRRASPTQTLLDIAHAHANEQGMFYSNAARGFFVFTTHQQLSDVLNDPEHFINGKGSHLYLHEPMPHRPLPMDMDAPEHTRVRQFLTPYFTPARVQGKFKSQARELARTIINRVADCGSCDAISDLGEPISAAITLNNMGVDPSLAEMLKGAVKQRSAPKTADAGKRANYQKGVATISDLFQQILAERRLKREEDIPSVLLDARIDGEPLDDNIILNLCCTTFAAGVHTSSIQLGFAFYHLAKNPELRQRIVDDPAIIPKAIEELMRWESSAVMISRTVGKPIRFHGLQLVTDDRIVMFQPTANRDPAVFENPDTINFERKDSRHHLSLGAGPHRCIGSFQARMILQIAMEEWHQRIPEYRLGDMDGVSYELSQAGGISKVPLEFH